MQYRRRRQRKEALDRLNQGRSALTASSEVHDEAVDELSRRRQELRESDFGDRSLPDLEQEVKSDLRRLQELGTPAVKNKLLLPAILCFILAVAAAAFYTATESIILVILAAVLCLGAVVLLLGYSRTRQAALQAQEQSRQILKKYKADGTIMAAKEEDERIPVTF